MEQETFGSDSQELLQETIEQTQLIQEELIEKQECYESFSQPELLQWMAVETDLVQEDVSLSPSFTLFKSCFLSKTCRYEI